MEEIKFEPVHYYKLSHDELRAMYIRMALCRFESVYEPACNPDSLIKKLTADFKTIVSEMQKIVVENPNNHTLRRINSFFNIHYSNLVELKNKQNSY